MKRLTVTERVWNQSAATLFLDAESHYWIRFVVMSEAGDLRGCYCRLTESAQYSGRYVVGFGKRDDREWSIPAGEVQVDNPNEAVIKACTCWIEMHSVGEVWKPRHV